MGVLIYMRIIVSIAVVVFFIGIYRNLIRKIIFILDTHDSDADHGVRKFSTILHLALNEAILQRRIKNRSTILWIRHLIIFGGFSSFFMMELVIGIAKNYQVFNSIMPAFKVGLDLSGCLLILGLLFALVHWIIYRETEQSFIDLQSLILLVGVISSGLLSVACRNLLSPDDSSFLTPLEHAIGKVSILLGCPLGDIHYWLFYFHITMAATVIAYIPFSKLLHIFATPIGRIATMGEGYVEKKRMKVSEGLL